MSRVDKPTLRCDRCGTETQDLQAMTNYVKLRHSHMSGEEGWDLCPPCWLGFRVFVRGES